jgi:transcription-repair coupling factor (superfamily II helicase)
MNAGQSAERQGDAENVSKAAAFPNGEGRERLFQRVAQAPSVAARLDALRRRPRPGGEAVDFPGVGESAQPFLLALLQRETGARRIWAVCEDLRAQERVHTGLQAWGMTSLFLPRMELAPIAGALPDPELNAERLSTLAQLAQPSATPLVAVIVKAQWSDEVPPADALSASFFRLNVGDNFSLESVAEKFLAAGFERVPRVEKRGQYAVRGGILDVFGWDQLSPYRLEWFGDTSNPSEPLTSTNRNRSPSSLRSASCSVFQRVLPVCYRNTYFQTT